jgi:NADH-quinone oxidoreductase subunit J
MPGGDFHPFFFVVIAAWILICGLGVVLFRKIVYSAVSMVFCFLGVAMAYALLNAELVAIIQILVYVGAISVVILFAIMLTEVQGDQFTLFFNRQTVFAAPVAVATCVILAVMLVSSEMTGVGEASLNLSVRELSELLFNRYVFPFELVSLVLLGAMIGAIVLARGEGEKR